MKKYNLKPITSKQIQYYDYNENSSNQDTKPISNNSLSLSFSITQKDSNIKNNIQSESSRRASFLKKSNKNNSLPIQENDLSTMLNQQILMLQSKLDQFQQRFLQKQIQTDKENKGNLFQNISKVSLDKKKKPQQKKTKDKSTNKKDNKVGKISSTTRFSVENKSLINKSEIIDYESKLNSKQLKKRRNSILDSKSIGTIKSLSRSKEKDMKNLKREVSKIRTSYEMSQLKRSKLQKNIVKINKELKKYKILEKKYKFLNDQHEKLRKNFQKSETIRQKQKKLLLTYKDQIKQLKQQLSKRKN